MFKESSLWHRGQNVFRFVTRFNLFNFIFIFLLQIVVFRRIGAVVGSTWASLSHCGSLRIRSAERENVSSRSRPRTCSLCKKGRPQKTNFSNSEFYTSIPSWSQRLGNVELHILVCDHWSQSTLASVSAWIWRLIKGCLSTTANPSGAHTYGGRLINSGPAALE